MRDSPVGVHFTLFEALGRLVAGSELLAAVERPLTLRPIVHPKCALKKGWRGILKAEIESRSAVFETFLTSLEKLPGRGISDRSYDDQRMIQEMAKFVWSMAPWRVFSTFTFKFEASVRTATKCFERFVAQTLPNVSVFFVIELHPGGHGGHVHALFDRDDFPRIAVWKAWKKRYGINRVEPINGFQNVCDYVSKYVVKAHAWWNFALSRSAWGRFCKREISFPLSVERNFGGGEQLPLMTLEKATAPEAMNPQPRAVGVPAY